MHYPRLLSLQIQQTKFGKEIPSSFSEVQTIDDYGRRPMAKCPLIYLIVPGQNNDNFGGFFGGGVTYLYDFFFQFKPKFR